MFQLDDPWWLVSLVLVVILWVMGAVIPVRILAPRVSVEQHFLNADESPDQDVPPPVQRPSLLLPVLTLLAGLGVVTLSLIKRINDPEGGARWSWMAAAAGLASFWAMILIMVSMRIR